MNEKAINEISPERLPLAQETLNCFWNTMDIPGREKMIADFISNNLNLSEPVPTVQPQPVMHGSHSSLPATSNWPGNYDFRLLLQDQEKINKHMTWTYSSTDNKLYIQKDAPCSFNFQTNTILSDDVFVRAMAVYSSAEHAPKAVTRCLNHSRPEIEQGLFQAEHIIRCESQMARYDINAQTKRHSVIVPFENPPVGQDYTTYIFKFVCFNSCSGGPNRRPLTLVFTLEQGPNVLGRITLDLKICSCPGRDRRLAEEEKKPKSTSSASLAEKENWLKSESSVPPVAKRELLDASTSAPQNFFQNFAKKKKPSNSGGKDEYVIKVKDWECYVFLKRMKRLFLTHKTVSGLPPDVKQIFQILMSSSDEDEKH